MRAAIAEGAKGGVVALPADQIAARHARAQHVIPCAADILGGGEIEEGVEVEVAIRGRGLRRIQRVHGGDRIPDPLDRVSSIHQRLGDAVDRIGGEGGGHEARKHHLVDDPVIPDSAEVEVERGV
jgi:hypothetical protein